MKVGFQHNIADGSCAAVWRGMVPPKDSDLPAGRAQVIFDSHPTDEKGVPLNLHAMRWNAKLKKLEPCPKHAAAQTRAEIMRQLAELDGKTMSAVRKFHLSGDKLALQDIETKAQALEAKLAALPVL